ncbi:CBL-interacting protein kinase 29-like [Ananas comosus]|uniref:non-specific serine/threonine protein kinase n=1 Tax=Ananas comosus TaxID=4615 RepID=A0A199UPU4_ANACO|nr:CBL-interacting protein kinase 29-like [Ananas comosus]OAY66837.1 CBL-interacting protein kinase 29 [Ananas comosus]
MTCSSAGKEKGEKVLFGRYELRGVLGRGATARVYLARDLRSGALVAVKSVTGLPLGSRAAVEREISLMARLRHPHVLRLLGVLASRSAVHLVLELAPGGDLHSLLLPPSGDGDSAAPCLGRPLGEGAARGYFRQLISAVAHAHSRGVFHRDLKPENLLLDARGHLKVADFGLGLGLGARPGGGGHSSTDTVCGTLAYTAPEVLSKRGYDPAGVDVWSCGVVLFVLTAGYLPFNHPNLAVMYRSMRRGEHRCPAWTSPELRRLLARIFDPNPETRITVRGIAADAWFRKGLDEREWTAMMRSSPPDHPAILRWKEEEEDEEEAGEEEEEEERGCALNAFHIISFSSGCDLSGLFEPEPADRERFVSAEPAESLLNRVEEVAQEEGLGMRRKGKEGGLSGVLLEGQNGNFVAAVQVHRIAAGLSVVEVEKGGGAPERRLWRERLGPALKKNREANRT